MRLIGPLLVATAVAATIPASAQVPPYDPPVLQLRSGPGTAYNLPPGASFEGQTPRLNQRGAVAIQVPTLPGTSAQGIWYGASGSGSVVHTAPESDLILGLTLNDLGMVIYEVSHSAQDGLYFVDTSTGANGFETDLPAGASGWGSPEQNAVGEVGYRAVLGGSYEWVTWDGSTAAVQAAEVGLDPGSPYSLLFPPSFNDRHQMAGKVRLGELGQVGDERPDQIRIFDADGSSTLVAEDQDSNPSAPYLGFDDTVSLNDAGWVAFVALRDDGHREVILSDGFSSRLVASEALPEIGSIEASPVAASSGGLVAFRGVDAGGLQAVAVGDGTELVRVVGEHDLVATDLGTARVDRPDPGPVFDGALSVSPGGDLAFHATLTAPDNPQLDWGRGVFVVLRAGLLFDEGFEPGTTAAWSSTTP